MLHIYAYLTVTSFLLFVLMPVMVRYADREHERKNPLRAVGACIGIHAIIFWAFLLRMQIGDHDTIGMMIFVMYTTSCVVVPYFILDAWNRCVTKKDLHNVPRDFVRTIRHFGTWSLCALRGHPEDVTSVIAHVDMAPAVAFSVYRSSPVVRVEHRACHCANR